jgi:hypothetical protein
VENSNHTALQIPADATQGATRPACAVIPAITIHIRRGLFPVQTLIIIS